MGEELRPEEAARALAEVEQRREQVMRLLTVPAWFWWAEAGLVVGLVVAIESGRPLVLGIGVTLFVIGILVVVGAFVRGSLRHAQPRRELMPPAGVFAILGFVALVLAVTLPTAFVLEATGVRYPATLGTSVAAIMLVLGGPVLTRHLQRIMQAHLTGGR